MSTALGSVFEDTEVDFFVLPTAAEVETMAKSDEFPASSFTSGDVAKIMDKPGNNAQKLVARAAAAALGGRHAGRTPAADMVVILDDLELDNLEQPELVIEVMRRAVGRHLETLSGDTRLQERTRAALRERVSLHLLKPMVESWLFPDPRALRAAGVTSEALGRLAHSLDPDCDPEDFRVDDGDYERAGAEGCTRWQAMARRTSSQRKRAKKNRPAWARDWAARPQAKARHPKAYLSWLCRDPASPKCSAYDETSGGARALAQLDWSALMAQPEGALFARALLEDIAECLGLESPFPGAVAPATARSVLPREPVLRNLW